MCGFALRYYLENASIPNSICGGPTGFSSFFFGFSFPFFLNRPSFFLMDSFLTSCVLPSYSFQSHLSRFTRLFSVLCVWFGGVFHSSIYSMLYFLSHVVCSKCDRMEVSEKRFKRKHFRCRKTARSLEHDLMTAVIFSVHSVGTRRLGGGKLRRPIGCRTQHRRAPCFAPSAACSSDPNRLPPG